MNKYNNIRKRGQIQMGETVAVVIIIIVLLVLGIAFWGRTSTSSIDVVNTESQELTVIATSNTVTEMPELKCYKSGVSEVKCLDLHKLLSMQDAMLEYGDAFKHYNNIFLNSKIVVQIIYPPIPNPNDENITIYDAKLNTKTDTVHIELPVNIKDDVNDITRYGLLIVEGYY